VSAASSLAAWGILRAPEVVELAAAVGLSLPAAATLLEKESGGGRNVWGSDPVPTGGAYAKGGAVTRENYQAYRRHLAGGTAGAQGVGPCQLTWRGYQDAADRIGGCWDWRCNVRVGFETLRDLQRQHGVRQGFRRYNGSGPMAEKYADDAMAKLARWTDRLGQPTPTPTARPPAAAPKDDDMNAEQNRLLVELYTQLVTGPDPGRWGWDAWPGGSQQPGGAPDRFTPVDYLRKSNQAAEDTRRDLAALRATVEGLAARVEATPAAAVQIDYAALARELIAAAKGA
jgi:hypothetical protein